jgi:hypothetical protein
MPSPLLAVMGNPPLRIVATLSRKAVALMYWHAGQGVDKSRPYKHDFAPGVTVQLLSDGSVRLYRPDGLPLFNEFPD